MENIIYVRLGNENKVIEVEQESCKISCIFIKKTQEKETLWSRYKHFKELKKAANQLRNIISTNSSDAIILEPAFLSEIEQNEKMKNMFLFLTEKETYNIGKSIILRLIIYNFYQGKKLEHLEELVLELPSEEDEFGIIQENVDEIIRLLSPTLNYLTIISMYAKERYEDLAEQLYEESGLMLQCIENKSHLEFLMKNKKRHSGSKSLWIDLNDTKVNYRGVPRNCMYLDANNQREKARILAVKRMDVSYISFLKFLDTLVDDIV